MGGWVVHTSCFLAGMVVFLGMRVVMMPPAVSIPMLRGATSSSSRSDTFSWVSPLRMAACECHNCQPYCV